jgi:thiamine-phosphate diphosphorylase
LTDHPIHGLYVIVDPASCRGRDPLTVARAAIEGGAPIVQWRDKLRDKGDQLTDARAIAGLCRERGVAFIVNDHADLALAAGADGVHLGQHDLPIDVVRPIVGASMIVGVSTNNAAEARAAEAAGADYVAIGSIFPTATKDVTRPASGGISAQNIAAVIDAGADAAAVISAVCSADDPRTAAAALASAFES